MPGVMIGDKLVRLTPKNAIGKGGEADIYKHNGHAIKIFKTPDDPDYQNDPIAQRGARERLAEQQFKLPAFPDRLPPAVVTPQEIAYNGTEVVGYSMRFVDNVEVLLKYGDRRYREQGAIDGNQALEVFRILHHLVNAVHASGVVIGDFNDLNVLVGHPYVYIVDADSMQFGRFHCRTFTMRFVDPLCLSKTHLGLERPHSTESDWYAFATMLFQTLLYVGPYGGVHRPPPSSGMPRLQHDARVLARITVFDGDVVYPRPAILYSVLPDDLLHHFQRVYEDDKRGEFPADLLDFRWTKCSSCGAEHARNICPACATTVKRETTVVRGSVKATRVIKVDGQILYATFGRDGKLRFLYHDGREFKREGGKLVVESMVDPVMRYRILGDKTIIGSRNRMWAFEASTRTAKHVDAYEGAAMFDVNEEHIFWLEDGRLVRDGAIDSAWIGDVIEGRTLFWAGDTFGLGFYRAGEIMRTFVFSSHKGFYDGVRIPPIPGQLVDSSCTFSADLAWLTIAYQHKGVLKHHCYVVHRDGNLLASGSFTWLADSIRGSFAQVRSLFVPSDDGILRIDLIERDGQQQIVTSHRFPDTEPFVDSTSYLLPGDRGIYVVSSNEINHLQIGGN